MQTFSTVSAIHGIVLILLLATSHTSRAQLIISQYYEGNDKDKWIEITNVGATPVNADESNFFLCLFSNTNADDPVNLSPDFRQKINGTIDPGKSIVYRHPLSEVPDYGITDGIPASICNFNGDDIIIISTAKDNTAWANRMDVIGNGDLWGENISYFRKATVKNPGTAFSQDQWTEVSVNAVNTALADVSERLGNHLYGCTTPALQAGEIGTTDILDISARLQWINGDGSARMVLIQEASEVNTFPSQGITYVANETFGLGSQLGSAFVIYQGYDNTTHVSNLKPETTYHVSVFEFDCVPPNYLLTDPVKTSFTTLALIQSTVTNAPEEGFDLGIVPAEESSETVSFTVTGSNLLEDIHVSVAPPFEISSIDIDWTNAFDIPVAEATDYEIRIRYRPQLSDGKHQSVIFLSTLNASDVSVDVTGTALPNAWINELHYDNIGGDKDEFVEFVIQNASQYNIGDFSMTLYNGADMESYLKKTGESFIEGDAIDNFMIYYWQPQNGSESIQNDLEGIALGYKGEVIQFLSYEGAFEAFGGIANGIISQDIGVSQGADTPEGLSLQLLGNGNDASQPALPGNVYEDFRWELALNPSPGSANNGQALPVVLLNFEGSENNENAYLNWSTASEINNYGFDIEKSVDGEFFSKIGFVNGFGTTSEIKHYDFTDYHFNVSGYYRLKQIDIDGNENFSDVLSVKKTFEGKTLFSVFPNPVKAYIQIKQTRKTGSNQMQISLFSIHGKKILHFNGDLNKINQNLNSYISNLQKGSYLLFIEKGKLKESHLLLKYD